MYIRHNVIFILFYRQEKDAGTKKVEKKSRESNDIVPPTHRSQHICDPTNVVDENNSGHGVQVDIAHGVAQRDDLLEKGIKEIIDQHGKKGRESLDMLNVMYY